MHTKHNWSLEEITNLFNLPFLALLQQATNIHLKHFAPDEIQINSLLSIKTGACCEDCAYCAQSAHHKTPLKPHELLDINTVIAAAKTAKSYGATRFCMGASGRNPESNQFDLILEMVRQVHELGLETCMTLGMLDAEQVQALKTAGLDYYNHNLDTSPEYYQNIVTTRTYEQRLATLTNLREARIKLCCGGIVGLGESNQDRLSLLQQLANFPEHPNSVPINRLIVVPGTLLAEIKPKPIDPFDFVRLIAVARILMPYTLIKLAGGRETMSDELQALCFIAGANSIFCGDKLLSCNNTAVSKDHELLRRLGINISKDISNEESFSP
jgi:biotin synthase